MTLDSNISRFQVEQEVGRGGMGIVYRAYDPVLDRMVALKLLAPHLGDDGQALARFQREAALVSGLKHANIALMYDSGEHEGRPFIAMEWVEGRTLKEMLADGPLTLDRSLGILDQLASALDHAHRRGIIHRDLKPANILIDDNDHVTIVDFGLAWLEDAPSLTMTGTFIGTPLYMSPEQIQGKPLDGRSDLYSMAVILYEMLSGSTPFGDAPTPVIIQQQLAVEPPPVTEFNPALPAHVEQALARALSKSPTDRFAAAQDLALALRESGKVTGGKTNGRMWLRLLVLALVVLAVGLSAWALWDQGIFSAFLPSGSGDDTPRDMPHWTYWPMQHGESTQSRYQDIPFYPLSDTPRWESYAEGEISTPMTGAGERIYFASGHRLLARHWTNGEATWEPPQLGAAITAPPAIYGDDENMFVIVATEDREVYALDGYGAGLVWRAGYDEIAGPIVGGMTVGPDGSLYAATELGHVFAYDVYSGDLLFTHEFGDEHAFLHPPTATASALFLASSEADIFAIDAATSEVAWVVGISGFPTTPVVFGEAWNYLFVGTDDGWLEARSTLTGARVWEHQQPSMISGIAVDWSRIYVTGEDGTVSAFYSDSGEPAWETQLDHPALFPPISNGNTLIIAAADGRIFALNADSGEPQDNLSIHLELPLQHAPMPIGGWLYAQTDDVVYAFGPE